jgi:putative ABC transport system ATP-binding protein
MSTHFSIEKARKVWNEGTANQVIAVDSISLDLEKGEFVTIVGSNAAGKSTLFNMIAGSVTPTSGSIFLDGKDITGKEEYERAKYISRVKQDPSHSLVSGLSVVENFTLSRLRGETKRLKKAVTPEIEETCKQRLAELGLGIEKRIRSDVAMFSGGQRQAIALLSAVEKSPELLLLDEHTAALDPKMAHKILTITDKLVKERGITTLMVTHNITHALQYGDRLIILESGKIKHDIRGEDKKKLTLADAILLIEKPADLEEEFVSK